MLGMGRRQYDKKRKLEYSKLTGGVKAALWCLSFVLAVSLAACSGNSEHKQVSEVSDRAASPSGQQLHPANDKGKPREKDELLATASGLFAPLPEVMSDKPLSDDMIKLGRMLFYETRLSKDNTVSCNSCHDLEHFGVDGRLTSLGVGGKTGTRNAPSVYNAALHVAQFWDGRSPNVEDQATGPVVNPVEMALKSEEAADRIKAIPEYKELFVKVFPKEKEPISLKNIGKAIGAFERKLVTPSPFDRFLRGDSQALTEEQKKGLERFISVGCVGCHNGVGVGGGQFRKLGEKEKYITKDLGRYLVTHKDADKYVFKVPSLRNVTETAPYFHDGSVNSLREAVLLMGKHQLGIDLADEDVTLIIKFLESLRGEIPADYIRKPKSI